MLKQFLAHVNTARAELRNIPMKDDQRYAIYEALEGMEQVFREATKGTENNAETGHGN